MINKFNFFRALFVVFLFSMFTGCASTSIKQPIFQAKEYQPQTMLQIIILPPVDSRFDKKEKVDLKTQLQESSAKILRKKGYQVIESPVINQSSQLTEEDLKSANPAFIKSLYPSGESRYLMVLSLLDLSTKLTFGSTGNAEISGYIFDKNAGIVVWHDKGIGQVGQGGLLGMLMKSGMDNSAIDMALSNLFLSIPKKDFVNKEK